MCSSAGVGYNMDMRLSVGDSVLTSPVLVWGADCSTIVQRALDGQDMNSENYWSGADSSAFHISDFSPKVPAEAKLQSEEEYAKLKQGQVDIFCNLTCGITKAGYATALPSLRRT